MCYKILKTDGQVACQTTLWSLTLEERADPEKNNLRDEFDTHVTYWLGEAMTMKYFSTSNLTPKYVYYEDPYSTILEGYIDEVLTSYELQGEVPKTIMTGKTADISNICEYDWYE